MQIRQATVNDAEAIATVHVSAWQETYRGIIPDDYLNQLSTEKRAATWRESLVDGLVFVAVDAKGLIGFAHGKQKQTESTEGELSAIYLLRPYQGRGIGRTLVNHVVRQLEEHGVTSLVIAVLADNPARHFYERLGGIRISECVIERGGKELEEHLYRIDLPISFS